VEITEVRIKLMEEPGERLQAFCSITFDDSFVVRDLKIIEGSTGPFVAMPSRKLTAHCPQCGCKNHLRAAYCNQCGNKLREQTMAKDEEGRAKLYADIAHPINSVCREMIQTRVIQAYAEEKARAQMPGYVPVNYDEYDAGPEASAEPVAKQSGVETTQIQPPELPQGPHRTPVRTAHEPNQANRPQGSNFGAGVFE
jgi:stage V sporulation protein G